VRKAFEWRKAPTSVVHALSELPFISTDERDALWFQSRDWRDLTWDQWNEYFRGLFFFTNEALAYYMPSIILVSMEPRNDKMLAADSLLMRLQNGIICAVGDFKLRADMMQLTREECDVLARWLQHLCSLPIYETGVDRARIDEVLASLVIGERPEDEG
jgi:hypothetical protein